MMQSQQNKAQHSRVQMSRRYTVQIFQHNKSIDSILFVNVNWYEECI